jgi:aspartyl-tRNA(Asn)/glutamyl-tRNA(Gln) amidotransferase subunit A
VTGSRSVHAALEGIDAWQERTNAFAQVFADEARAEAADVGTDGRLGGLPIAVKDLLDVRGHPTTGCCAAIPPESAERDAALVTRLRDEGAIVIGKTNQHELAAGVTNLESSCGPTRNPWHLQRITGAQAAARPSPSRPASSRSAWSPTPVVRPGSPPPSVGPGA